ncbi:MAG: hypothetical protein HY763_04270 [Planctomycetes bacterium]|nr:hypothetical protein [Planctomycetota bacterium]
MVDAPGCLLGPAVTPFVVGRTPAASWATVLFLALSGLGGLVAEPVAAGPVADRAVVGQIPPRDDKPAANTPGGFDELPNGSRLILVDFANPDGAPWVLTPDFTAAGRPTPSFDAERILFVARRGTDDVPAVWEMDADGRNPRRIVAPAGGAGRAVYLSTVYSLDAAEPAPAVAFHARDPHAAGGALYTCTATGDAVQRITYVPHGASDPLLLADGRLLFSAWAGAARSLDSIAPPLAAALHTVYPDGTDVSAFAPAKPGAAYRASCETDDGWIIFNEAPTTPAAGGARLMAVRRTESWAEPRPLIPSDEGTAGAAAPLDRGKLAVSFRARKGGTFALYVLDMDAGGPLRKLYDDPDWDEIDVAILRPRVAPAGRATVVNRQVSWGQLYCMDVAIGGKQGLLRDDGHAIRRVRVVAVSQDDAPAAAPRAEPEAGSAAAGSGRQRPPSANREQVLGEATVEADGSFFLEVPARTPLRLETVDAGGAVVRRMERTLWVMPGERRGCIGCHEHPALAPPNRHVLALRKPPQRVAVEP